MPVQPAIKPLLSEWQLSGWARAYADRVGNGQ